ncbi:MAG: hypothetical protein ACRDVL_08620 [Acidimicrobiia bacterium]
MTPYERFAAACAVAVAAVGLIYSVAFVALLRGGPGWLEGLTAVLLLAGGLLSSAVLVALYQRIKETDPAFALWALLLGALGAAGTAVHGGFDLANYFHPSGPVELPNAVDPRGLLTFGVAGLALFVIAWLIVRGGRLPVGLGYLGYLSATLLVATYLGRMILLDPNHPALLAPAALEGLIVNPLWYVWLGVALRGSGPSPASSATPAAV